MQRFQWKQIVLSVLIFATADTAFAQSTETAYTTVKPFTGSKEFRKFSVGINVGALAPSILLGGSNDFTKSTLTLGYGANVRYQFNHYFALQADYLGGKLKGDNTSKLGNGQAPTRPISLFETTLKYAASLSGQLTFGNVNWLREKNTIVPYISVGAGLLGYSPKIVRAPNTTTPLVDYDNNTSKKEFFVPVGAGLRVNLSKLINLDLGYRMQFVDGDNFDGSSYWTTRGNSLHKDKFSYGYLGLEFVLGKSAKQKMLFDNPASRTTSSLQSQIDTIKTTVDALKNDTDGDGVADIFDKEPNTPAGSPVDTHGVTKDTDGDGVPDWKDKQLITPTECQPVDADGVGKCPEPACCATLDSLMKAGSFTNGNCPTDYPSLTMKGTSLSKDAKAMCATVASKLKEKPTCTITVTAYPGASKAQQSLADKKLDAVKNYLVEKLGISGDRIATDKNVGGGDVNVIDIK